VLVLLDERTWTSGADTAKFVEHIHMAMRTGVHICCVHEVPAVVGPHRHACDFTMMFHDDWTPAHLTGGRTNLYREVDVALKGEEWRQPGLVALADKLSTSAGEHTPQKVMVPSSYEPKTGANPWDDESIHARSSSVTIEADDHFNSRGSIVLEDGATFLQVVPSRRDSSDPFDEESFAEGENFAEGRFEHSRMSVGAAAAMLGPPPKPAPPPKRADAIELGSMPPAMAIPPPPSAELVSMPPAIPIPPPPSAELVSMPPAMPFPPPPPDSLQALPPIATTTRNSVTDFLSHRLLQGIFAPENSESARVDA